MVFKGKNLTPLSELVSLLLRNTTVEVPTCIYVLATSLLKVKSLSMFNVANTIYVAGKVGSDFNMVVWRFSSNTAKQTHVHR